VDQTLTQVATGTLVMLALEALELDRVHTEASAQYVDHNLIQEDHKNPDDHLFLESAARRFGLHFSRPGSGVSHPVHMEELARPGATLLGSDSHTPASGAVGCLAIGTGGLDVALAMAGAPYRFPAPAIWRVELEGALPEWVSAKDVILELLRRHGVAGGKGFAIEWGGPGLAALNAWDRHVLCNMGTELGATTSVCPADGVTEAWFAARGRRHEFRRLEADPDARYDRRETIDLGALEPMVALPSSPGNVVPVREVAGEPIYQAYVGSSANPGFHDFAVVADTLAGRRVAPGVSLDLNPGTQRVLRGLLTSGLLEALVAAGGRLHEVGCNGCIGMGQAPASGRASLRTVPRNFPGRSGTREDRVFLVSPETAAASALRGEITDPRTLDVRAPRRDREEPVFAEALLAPPPPREESATVALIKGPNVGRLPDLDPMPERLEAEVVLALGDDVSTDEILPAGARVLPFRSNVPKIAEFCFEAVDDDYVRRAQALRDGEEHLPHAIVAGKNYGQGSSREHAAVAPRHLGLRLVLAEDLARIHRQNLVNYGVLPLLPNTQGKRAGDPFREAGIVPGARLVIDDLPGQLKRDGGVVELRVRPAEGEERRLPLAHDLSPREVDVLLAGGAIPALRRAG